MPFNGSGTYTLPGAALATGGTISATEHNSFRNDVASALTNCVTRDGQSPATANMPMGGYKVTGLAAASTNGDAVRFEQLPVIGVQVQAYSANLDEYAAVNPTAAGLALLDDADAAAQRTTLGLGSAATLTAGTSANNLVQLDGTGKLPAVDGSQLTGLPGSSLPSQTGNSGKFLTTNGTSASWGAVSQVPTQTGNSGKFLTTDGTNASWAATLPTQTGNSGKFLTTDGTTASWAAFSGVAKDNGAGQIGTFFVGVQGGTVASGATVAGASLGYVTSTISGSTASAGLSGTWRNVIGSQANPGELVTWQRVA